MLRKTGLPGALAAALFAVTTPAHAEWALNMTRGVTTMSGEIYSLHMTIFWWCVAIGIFVFGWMIVSLVRYRKSKGAIPDTTMVHSTKAEILWTIIPVIILVVMAVPAARTLIRIEDASGTEVSIKVTGYQWKWHYDYMGEGVDYFSSLERTSDEARQRDASITPESVEHYLLDVDNPLVVPVGRKVRLLVTSRDVIHAWWVPALAVKKDAIPGFINELWFEIQPDKPGLYRGQCAELCGRDHGFMPIVVQALSQEDYDAWLKTRREAQAAALTAAR